MMIFKYSFLIMFFSFFLPINTFVQAQEIMYLKQAFQQPLENKVVNSKGENINYSQPFGTKNEIGRPWVVFSDRNNNKTYEEADITSNSKVSNIGFMEKFFVIDEKDIFVKIAQGKNTQGEIRIDNVYGWILKANLLLWTHCIYNENEIAKKALLLNNLDIIEEGESIKLPSKASFYTNPAILQKDFRIASSLSKVYYIYKVLPDAILLGKQKSFASTQSDAAILGWISPKNIVFWDSRVCIEQNSKADAVDERMKHNDEYLFFDTKDAAKVYRDGGIPSSKHVIMKMKDYEYDRCVGNVMRFPVLSENDDILKVVVIGEVVEKTAQGTEIKKPKKKKKRKKAVIDALSDNEKSKPVFRGAKVAYTVLKKNNNTNYNLYEYVLLLGNDELAEMTNTLKSFSETDLTHEALLSLIENTWLMLLSLYEGIDINDYADLTLSQIHEKVFVLPVQSSFLNTIKLKEIKDMDKETANKYIETLGNTHSVLNNILMDGANHNFAFKNDNDIYYWILERELP